jgi:RNase P subunit RPR2
MSRIDKKAVAKEIDRLFNLALSSEDELLKRSAIRHAVALSRSVRVKIPKKYSLFICRKCLSLLSSSKSARIRVRKNRNWQMVIRCLTCGSVKRIPLKR